MVAYRLVDIVGRASAANILGITVRALLFVHERSGLDLTGETLIAGGAAAEYYSGGGWVVTRTRACPSIAAATCATSTWTRIPRRRPA